MRNNRAMHRIAVLALDDVVGLDLGTPSQVFGTARTGDLTPLYRVEVCTPGGRPIRSTAGFQVVPDHGLELLESADTVIVPGIHDGPPLTDGTLDAPVAGGRRAGPPPPAPRRGGGHRAGGGGAAPPPAPPPAPPKG
ncbi:hypothetical protein ACWEH1_07175, partial [Micromonospora chersina]